MIHLRLEDATNPKKFEKRIDTNYQSTFEYILQNSEVPPFRDEESLKFITEVDRGTLVPGDWYSYISPFGRTCMSSLCSGTKYALTCIANSKKGIYTPYNTRYGMDIFGRLSDLKSEILLIYDIFNDEDSTINVFQLPNCVIENFCYNGEERSVIFDENGRSFNNTTVIDEQGQIHVCFHDFSYYSYNWKKDLPNIYNLLQRSFPSQTIVWELPATEVSIQDICNMVCGNPYWDDPALFPCKIFLNMTECPIDGIDKYPRIFYIQKFKNGTYAINEHCPVKYPNFAEIIDDIIELYDSECEQAFAAVFDCGAFLKHTDFNSPILWCFYDNGTELTCYSKTLGHKKLLEFLKKAL